MTPSRAEALVLAGLDELELNAVAAAYRAPLQSCPRSSCRSSTFFVVGNGWACLCCGGLGGPAAFVAAWLYDLDFDQVQDFFGGGEVADG